MTDKIERAAKFLVSARAADAPLETEFPADLKPDTQQEVVAIQLATLAEIGPIGGWKVGAPNPTGTPVVSPLPARGIVDAPAKVASRARGVECEISFRFAKPLPPKAEPYLAAEVLAAIGTCQAAVEIVSSRFIDHMVMDPLSVAADLGAHDGLVVGAPVDAWTPDLFANLGVIMVMDGAEHKRAVGSNPGGTDLIRLLVGLANADVVRAAGGIKIGQVATTGSWTGIDFLEAGGQVAARFANFPEVDVTFA
jgi:2-keto-4-pentenoate hydratase